MVATTAAVVRVPDVQKCLAALLHASVYATLQLAHVVAESETLQPRLRHRCEDARKLPVRGGFGLCP